MSKRLDESLGAVGCDDLFASVNPSAEVAMVTIDSIATAGAKRGTLIVSNSDTMFKPVSEEIVIGMNVYILAEDVPDNTVSKVSVYRTGHFVTGKVLTNGTYTLTADDKRVLRQNGILLTDGMEY